MKIPLRDPAFLGPFAVYFTSAFLLLSGATRGWPWPVQLGLVYVAIAGVAMSASRVRDHNARASGGIPSSSSGRP